MKKINKNAVVEKASRTFYKAGFKLKKHSPEILVVGGVVGLVASGVMACKATTKLSTILDDSKEQIEMFDKVAANPEMVNEEYTAEDAEKDKKIVKVQTAVKVAKLYAPSVAVGQLERKPLVHPYQIRQPGLAISCLSLHHWDNVRNS